MADQSEIEAQRLEEMVQDTSPQNNIKNLSTQVRSVLLNQPDCYVTYMTSEWNPPVKSTLIHNYLEKY